MKKIKDIIIWQKQCMDCRKTYYKGEVCPPSAAFLLKEEEVLTESILS